MELLAMRSIVAEMPMSRTATFEISRNGTSGSSSSASRRMAVSGSGANACNIFFVMRESSVVADDAASPPINPAIGVFLLLITR